MSGPADFLTKQVGPLPMGAWLLVGGGGLFIASRREKAPAKLTEVREVPVPVGAIASADGAPVVITPIFRVPELPTPQVVVVGTGAAVTPPAAAIVRPPTPGSLPGPWKRPRDPVRPTPPGVAAPGAPPRGTAGYLTVNGQRVHVNTAGIIDTRGAYYGKYPLEVLR